MTTSPSSYIPALRYRFLTRFYDPVLRLFDEDRFKRALVEQASVAPGHRVLDLGCGTGTLTILVKQACPDATVVGLDGDPDVLARAREKARAAGVTIEFHEGMAFDPPYPPGSFDRVVSSLVFHHLVTADKRRTLARMCELLRPDGELHVADWGEAKSPLMRVAFLGVQLLDGFATTNDNVRGLLVPFMKEAGFSSVDETRRWSTIFGPLSLYRATKPPAT